MSNKSALSDYEIMDNSKVRVEIQIDDEAPFVPDALCGDTGNTFGMYEPPGQDKTNIRGFLPKSSFATTHYIRDGLEVLLYYRRGTWTTTADGTHCFHVRGMLDDNPRHRAEDEPQA